MSEDEAQGLINKNKKRKNINPKKEESGGCKIGAQVDKQKTKTK